jgi:mycobactin lysine-N-oxygenase
MTDQAIDQTEKLLILGGGPKAAAVCAKCHILRKQGFQLPRPIVFEQNQLGAAWIGTCGFTDGQLQLGTPPEKDVGFPYAPDPPRKGPQRGIITSKLYGKFSWNAYTLTRDKGLGDWIDRGRPHPTHEEWAKYIAWVITVSMSDLAKEHEDYEKDGFINGKVTGIAVADGRWKLTVAEITNARDRTTEYVGEKLLITGTGAAKCPEWAKNKSDLIKSDRIMFGDTFWEKNNREKVDELPRGEANPIVIVGGGETAASIAAYLAEKKFAVHLVTRSGTIFSRGEGYYENQIYTNTTSWQNLPDNTRREIIRRTDRGVFSPGIIAKLAAAGTVDHRSCEVTAVEQKGDHIEISGPSPAPNGPLLSIPCQLLIIAMGFDALSFTGMIAEDELRAKLSDEQSVRSLIQSDLSVQLDGYPKLYLPMLAGFAQGPGFPNLSCLGLLSDRILGRPARKARV